MAVEPVVAAEPVAEPVVVVEPSFLDALNDHTYEMNDDGELNVGADDDAEPVAEKVADGETEEKTVSPEDGAGDDPSDDADSAADPQDSPAVLTKRFKDTQAALTSSREEIKELRALVTTITTALQDKTAPAAEEEVDLQDIMADPKKFKEYLVNTIKATLQPELEPLRASSEDSQIRRELADAMATFPDFRDYASEIQKVVTKFPNLTYAEAYGLAKDLGAPRVRAISKSGEAGDAAPVKKSVEELRAKARKLATESGGVAASREPKPGHATSVREAFDQALIELDMD